MKRKYHFYSLIYVFTPFVWQFKKEKTGGINGSVEVVWIPAFELVGSTDFLKIGQKIGSVPIFKLRFFSGETRFLPTAFWRPFFGSMQVLSIGSWAFFYLRFFFFFVFLFIFLFLSDVLFEFFFSLRIERLSFVRLDGLPTLKKAADDY